MILKNLIYQYFPNDMRKTTKKPLDEQAIYQMLPSHAQIFLDRALSFAKRTKTTTYFSIDKGIVVCMCFDLASFNGSLNYNLSELIYMSDDLLIMPQEKFAVDFNFFYDKI